MSAFNFFSQKMGIFPLTPPLDQVGDGQASSWETVSNYTIWRKKHWISTDFLVIDYRVVLSGSIYFGSQLCETLHVIWGERIGGSKCLIWRHFQVPRLRPRRISEPLNFLMYVFQIIWTKLVECEDRNNITVPISFCQLKSEREIYMSNQRKPIELSLKIALLKVGSINRRQENDTGGWLQCVEQSTLLAFPLSWRDQMN